MKISVALQSAAGAAQMSDTAIAAAVGVSQASVRAWLRGDSEPRFDNLKALIRIVPGFGKLVGLELAA